MNKIAIISFGLEHIKRGVEANALLIFNTLSVDFNNVYLIKGSGKCYNNQIVIKSPKSTSLICKLLGDFRGGPGYWESLFFTPPLIYHIIRKRITTIYTQERIHAIVLSKLKKWTRKKLDIIYCEAFQNFNNERLHFATKLQEINILNYEYIKQECNKVDNLPEIVLLQHFYTPPPPTNASSIKAKIHNFKRGKKVILFVGDHDHHHKNFQYLLDEITKIPFNDFVLLGCGHCSAQLRESIRHILGTNYMNLLVTHQEMPIVYGEADLFVLPSLDEGFGLSIIEAFCYKLPVILHLNKHFLSLTNDPSQHVDMTMEGALSNKLITALHDDQLLREKGAYNYNRYRENYSWESTCSKYFELFNLKPFKFNN